MKTSHEPSTINHSSPTILGIETSCDETAAAVVRSPGEVLSSIILSQTELHGPYGGVVPEIASRSHVRTLPAVVADAVQAADVDWGDLNGVAATYGPGLASSLLVGICAARALACRLGIPVYGVNHLEAHIYSVFVSKETPEFEAACPFIALIVSGGHTSLVRVTGPGDYRLLGQTIDDAAGEAFDKGANLLGLGYPGGPVIDKTARDGDPKFVRFPRGKQRKGKTRFGDLDAELCFSFSGLKTALLYYLRDNPLSADRSEVASLAASYQEAIVDALVDRCRKVMKRETRLVVCGGVSLNSRLRTKLNDLATEMSFDLHWAEPRFCADNAAMVGAVACAGLGISGKEAERMDACPSLGIG